MAKKNSSALSKALGESTQPRQIRVVLADPNATPVADLKKFEDNLNESAQHAQSPLIKSILNVLDGRGAENGGKTIERLAFEQDPTLNNEYSSLYFTKIRLIPDMMLKRIAIQDDLVAAIVNTRSAQLAAFGRPRPDRHSTGFIIEPNTGILDGATDDQKKDIEKRIDKVEKMLLSCGETKGWKDKDKLTFAQFLGMTVRDSIIVGRFAVEVVYVLGTDGKRKFHSFRPIDAGTTYRAAPQKNAADQVRKQARFLLEQLKNKKLQPEKFENDEYSWVQVIEGKPVQAFTAEECLVHNMYPVTDVMLAGYPLTPIDTMIAAVTTHINITTHNKLYFQSGRASRGMLVIKSDDVKESDVAAIRQHFNASINSVNNAWRMPVFGLGSEDEIQWMPIDGQSRDMEFQYLSDSNARVILSAFQMSPEELPGYAHLSRGTNNQALSESNNEYKLEAARDVGIRPLIMQFQDFINASLFPLLDENLSKICTVKLVGLDSDTAEKESTRIQQDMPVHLTINDVMDIVEKDPVPKELCGDLLLNPQYLQHLDKYVPVGLIMEKLMGVQGAAKDPKYAYVRDPFWFQWQQLQMQAQQMQQQAAQGGGGGGGGGEDGGGGGEGGGGGGEPSNDQGVQREDSDPGSGGAQEAPGGSGEGQQQPSGTEQDIDAAAGALGKSEFDLLEKGMRMRELAEHLKPLGWRYEKTTGGHPWKLIHESGHAVPIQNKHTDGVMDDQMVDRYSSQAGVNYKRSPRPHFVPNEKDSKFAPIYRAAGHLESENQMKTWTPEGGGHTHVPIDQVSGLEVPPENAWKLEQAKANLGRMPGKVPAIQARPVDLGDGTIMHEVVEGHDRLAAAQHHQMTHVPVVAALGKSEHQLPPSKRRLLHQQEKLVKNWLKDLEADSESTLKEILGIADAHAPKHKP